MYKVADPEKIGMPDVIRNLALSFVMEVNGIVIPFKRNIVYKYNDPAFGEVYQPFDVVPAVTTKILNKVQLFKDNRKQVALVKVKAGKDNCEGTLKLDLPSGWKVTPDTIPFSLNKKGSEIIASFEVTPPSQPDEAEARSIAVINGKEYDREQVIIDYPHINLQQVLLPSVAKFTKADIEIRGKKVAYIMGAGDNIPESLRQMGYEVSLLSPQSISTENLKHFDAVIMGIRAYNVLDI